MPLRVKVDPRLMSQLRKSKDQVLRDLAPVTRQQVSNIRLSSLALVPIGNVDPAGQKLADSDFVDGPLIHEDRESVSSTCGYEHPHAGAIHEGFHWGLKLKAPTNFLRIPAREARRQVTRAFRNTIKNTLGRLFPAA